MSEETENEKVARLFNERVSASTIEEFMKYFNMYPRGEPQLAYETAKYHVISQKTFPGNASVTWQLIYEKWESYLAMCKGEATEDQYIMGMGNFIKNKKYNEDFKAKLSSWMKKFS